MFKYRKCAKFTLCIVYFFILLLAALAVALPFLVTWYVETKGRPADLATVVMVTCYPCTPLAAIALLSARKLLKNILGGEILCQSNISLVRRICLACFFAGIIMLVAGFFYMPFYIASAAALVCALVLKIVCDLATEAFGNKTPLEDEKQ